VRGLLRLFDESMQQDHSAFLVDIEKHSGDSVQDQVCSHFINTVAQWPGNGHPNWPAKLYCFDVLADAFPILG